MKVLACKASALTTHIFNEDVPDSLLPEIQQCADEAMALLDHIIELVAEIEDSKHGH